MKATHTQGDWKANGIHVRNNKSVRLCSTQGGNNWHISEEEAIANAKLIASAPALLEVLQEIVENLQPIRGQRLRKAINAIKQATE